MWFWQRWQQERDRARRAARFVDSLRREPEPEAVAWLARHGTHGDADHATWELRYARRALGLIAAERDALDDGTASLVSAALAASLRVDPTIAAGSLERVERQLAARVRSYAESLATRRGGVPPTAQLGTALLAFAGTGTDPYGDAVDQAARIMGRYLDEANAGLVECFGAATVPGEGPLPDTGSAALRR